MKVVLSQGEGTLFLSSMRDAIKSARHPHESPWKRLYRDVERISASYCKHGIGLVTFDTTPAALHEVKRTLIRSGVIKTSEHRMMIMRLDESLSLFYGINRSEAP